MPINTGLSITPGMAPSRRQPNQARITESRVAGRQALTVTFTPATWPGVTFTADPVWDWSDQAGMAVDVYNPGKHPVTVFLRVDNTGANGLEHCNTAQVEAIPGRWTPLELRMRTPQSSLFWGMRGQPGIGPAPFGPEIDPSRIVGFVLFLASPPEDVTLAFAQFRLLPRQGRGAVTLPFVDRFGQYKHADWPGKLHSESELSQRTRREAQQWTRRPVRKDMDAYGGWLGGPQLKATGRFRTDKLNNRWWLVTPDGHLFWSIGMDCVTDNEGFTFVSGREGWHEWVPAADDPVYGAYCRARFGKAHSMAERIGGEGDVVNFIRANLIRRYGPSPKQRWAEVTGRRLRRWGINTIANWSDMEMARQIRMPYVISRGPAYLDFRRLTTGGGYWAPIYDVFDAAWKTAVEQGLWGMEDHAADPYCIGCFFDNELAWEGVEKGVLTAPADQPARLAFLDFLRERYDSLDSFNRAWNTAFADWNAIAEPQTRTERCVDDLHEFTYRFAAQYFRIIRDALRSKAPGLLYLGCRFAWSHPQAIRAAAEYCDVISFNAYVREIDASVAGQFTFDRPVMIGEFHFGALDRGMFHQGLVPVSNQRERGRAYQRYMRSAAREPRIVGAHWFQYTDQSITGRWFDGENYNIGFVDVTDTPYPELSEAARIVNHDLIANRWWGKL